MPTATAPEAKPRKKKTRGPAPDDVLATYRRLTRAQRRRISRAADKKMRATLAAIERDMALKRSPGSMAADPHRRHARSRPPTSHLIDRVFRDIARGHPPQGPHHPARRRHGKSPPRRPLGAPVVPVPATPATAS
jgi:hypothetical protein